MIKGERKAVYECPVDTKHTIKDGPHKKIICPYCHVQMQEVVQGIVNK